MSETAPRCWSLSGLTIPRTVWITPSRTSKASTLTILPCGSWVMNPGPPLMSHGCLQGACAHLRPHQAAHAGLHLAVAHIPRVHARAGGNRLPHLFGTCVEFDFL